MLTMNFKLVFAIALLLVFMLRPVQSETLLRSKRFLIFPRQAPTRHQFIGGIGIPADLSYESLTTGYVLKAEYWLPFNATVFRENPFFPEYQNALNNRGREFFQLIHKPSQLRWHVYEFLINRLDSFGYNGEECLLKAVCEANAIPFERNLNLFAEIMHIIFSPSSSTNREHVLASNFREAEKFGRQQGDCNIYACNMSLMNLISQVLNK